MKDLIVIGLVMQLLSCLPWLMRSQSNKYWFRYWLVGVVVYFAGVICTAIGFANKSINQ